MSDHVISGLIRRRRELTGDMLELLAKVDVLQADVEAIDKVLRQFDPGIALEVIPALQCRPKPDWAQRGDVARIVFAVLREATEPISTHDITAEVQRRRGVEGQITALHLKRMRKCLDRQGKRGRITPVVVNGVRCWMLAR